MLEINAARLLADLEVLAAIGQTPEGGVSRLALSAADRVGCGWRLSSATGPPNN